MITVSRLRAWSPHALEDAADDLEGARRRLDQVVEDVQAAARHADGAWSGAGAAAALARLRAHGRRGQVLTEEMTVVRRAMHAAAQALDAAKELLARAQDLAAANHLQVTDTGRVVPVPGALGGAVSVMVDRYVPYEPAVTARVVDARALRTGVYPGPTVVKVADATAVHRQVQLAASQVQTMVDRALAAAADADAAAAAAVRAARVLAADGSSTDPVDRAVLALVGASELPPVGTDPRAVAAWWASLAPRVQQMWLRRRPEVIGALDGVPAAVRDRANRAVLAAELERTRRELEAYERDNPGLRTGAGSTDPRAKEWTRIAGRLTILEVVDQQVSAPGRQLLLLDAEPPGRAAVVVGDMDTADHVAVLVPGFGSAVTNYLPIITANADAVATTAESLLDAVNRPETVAVVGWVGYHAPQGLDVAVYGRAEAGAEQLRATLWGIEASRRAAGSSVHLTTVGHSYGSVVSGLASQAGTPMDDLVVLGSPGAGVADATVLDVGPNRVFVGAAADDFVSHLGRFGPDPASARFGGNVFDVSGGPTPAAPTQWLAPASGHSAYYGVGTESVTNIASIVIGHPEQTTLVSPVPRREPS